jgi:hypothetical protein
MMPGATAERRRRAGLPAFIATLSLVALASPSAAHATVPRGFVGMMADGPVFARGVKLDNQLSRMVAVGVQRVRVAFYWSQAQPYAKWSDVPPDRVAHFAQGRGGAPTAFQNTDNIVSQAAKHHLPLLPVVTYAPSWDASSNGDHRQPARDGPYGQYLTSLVQRYGPTGTFWKMHPTLPKSPITSWQIWNEPDLSANWNTVPFAPSYVALLRVARHAIKKSDASAKVVLGALTNYGWRDLASIYAVRRSRRLFDVVAANPYTRQPSGVITILGDYRQVMAKHGDADKPIIASEVGWPSATGKATQDFGFNVTERGQARKLSKLLPLLAQNRRRLRLAGFYYYTWMTSDPPHAGPFQYAGLLRYQQSNTTVRPKPAYQAFRRTVARLE